MSEMYQSEDEDTVKTAWPTDKPKRSPRRNRSDSAEPVRARRVVVDDEPLPGGDDVEAIEKQLASNVKMSPERRKALARRRRQLLTRPEDNPFINERPGVLPVVDYERDANHVYHWVRTQIAGQSEGDRSNLAAKQTGHLQYEFVKLSKLPEDWQAKFAPFHNPLNDTIGYKDVVLARCSKRVRDMRLAAMENEADVAADQLNGRLRAEVGAKGNTRARIEEDTEEGE